MRKDTERVLTVLLALALALLAITAFALARAQQRIRLNEVANSTRNETLSVAAVALCDVETVQNCEGPGITRGLNLAR